LRTTTTGTTGTPTSVSFSAYELRTIVALAELAHHFSGSIDASDIVQISTSARAALGNLALGGASARIGALVSLSGIVDPAHTLALLAAEQRIPGKKRRVSVLSIYPSYLGELVECGLRSGYRPADFGLERLFVGGELVTAGLRARCQHLFGPVEIIENYALTETAPFGGTRCSEGHLHFDLSHGLLEVLNPETGAPAPPGALGTIVATPFPPFRDTTILLRYDTEDLVRPVAGPLTCNLRTLPATTAILGKLRGAVRHDDGWTTPRDVAEALEAIEAVPLPARYGVWAVPGGVAVEVVARADTPAARRAIAARLEERGVPLRSLCLVSDRTQLRCPAPLRCDLREQSFSPSPAV
jgi:phenylacetate-coenzyme A ligase PaaK-like adenylate-forming protein